jgi:methylmalonyl-CoA mutase N-terminal domain/subunit
VRLGVSTEGVSSPQANKTLHAAVFEARPHISGLADAAYREQERHEKGRLVKVGVNEFVDEDEESVRHLRAARDNEEAAGALDRLRAAAKTDGENLLPPLIECARAYCTEGEIVGALHEVFGEYLESPRF